MIKRLSQNCHPERSFEILAKRICLTILLMSMVLGPNCRHLTPTSRLAQMPDTYTNSIGMKFVRIEPGSFLMGQEEGGDWDEQPVHKVTLTKPFYMAVTEVTNAQYEQFDSDHCNLRGKLGFSNGDDDAVVFVSWHLAV